MSLRRASLSRGRGHDAARPRYRRHHQCRALPSLTLPLRLAALALAGIAGYLANWGHEDCPVGKPISLQNPIELRVVLEFGALLAVIMAATKLLSAWAGSEGEIMLAAVSGLIDVDAITISLARLAPQGLAPTSAGGQSSWWWWQTACPRLGSRWPWAAGRSAASSRAESLPHSLWRRSGSRRRYGDALPGVLVASPRRASHHCSVRRDMM